MNSRTAKIWIIDGCGKALLVEAIACKISCIAFPGIRVNSDFVQVHYKVQITAHRHTRMSYVLLRTQTVSGA